MRNVEIRGRRRNNLEIAGIRELPGTTFSTLHSSFSISGSSPEPFYRAPSQGRPGHSSQSHRGISDRATAPLKGRLKKAANQAWTRHRLRQFVRSMAVSGHSNVRLGQGWLVRIRPPLRTLLRPRTGALRVGSPSRRPWGRQPKLHLDGTAPPGDGAD